MERYIKFKIGEELFEIEADFLEELLTEGAVLKIEEATENLGAMKGVIKSFLSIMIKKPKEFREMDDFEYLVRDTIPKVIGILEAKTHDIPARKVEEDKDE